MSTQEAPQGGTTEFEGERPSEQQPSAAGQPGESGGPGQPGGPGGPGQPSEEELRAAYEAELSRITSADMVLQATVSLLNIGARRLGLVGGPEGAGAPQSPERDLEQVRDAIDAVRGLMGVIERRAPQEARALREALSQLQMAYAREAQAAAPAPAQAQTSAPESPPAGPPPGGKPAGKPGAGPAESSGRLWVPGR